jgi:ABC-type lipoprotein export system ATPase subunit
MKSVNVSNAYSKELVLDVPQGTAVILSKKVIMDWKKIKVCRKWQRKTVFIKEIGRIFQNYNMYQDFI